MPQNRPIKKIAFNIYCWENEVDAVKAAFAEWWGNEDHTLVSGSIEISSIIGDEEVEVRSEMEEGEGDDLDVEAIEASNDASEMQDAADRGEEEDN